MKTTVIYHSADMDGIFCREIARKFLPDAELIGWDFADKLLPIPLEGLIYILDLPADRPFGLNYAVTESVPGAIRERLIWIDHHKSSIETHPTNIPGYQIDGVAACRLAWVYFTALERYKAQTLTADFTWLQGHYPWPTKQDFIDRKVEEPLAVRLAGEYDIWDKRDPDAEVFQFGLRSMELDGRWNDLLCYNPKMSVDEVSALVDVGHQGMLHPDGTVTPPLVLTLLENGKLLQTYQQRNDKGVVEKYSFLAIWEDLKFLCLNTTRFNSLTFAAKDVPETGHDALLGFNWNGRVWTVSLYHANHRKDLDLSVIAKKWGGGGHRGAAGMTMKSLPFLSQ
jgi:hypothetical protein